MSWETNFTEKMAYLLQNMFLSTLCEEKWTNEQTPFPYEVIVIER